MSPQCCPRNLFSLIAYGQILAQRMTLVSLQSLAPLQTLASNQLPARCSSNQPARVRGLDLLKVAMVVLTAVVLVVLLVAVALLLPLLLVAVALALLRLLFLVAVAAMAPAVHHLKGLPLLSLLKGLVMGETLVSLRLLLAALHRCGGDFLIQVDLRRRLR